MRDYHGNVPPKKFYWEDLNLLGGIINQKQHLKHFMILRLYGYLEVQLLNQVIVQLCYSSNHILNANGITYIGFKKKTQQAIVLKPDTLVFNFVLKAWHECLDVQ